MLLTHPHFIGRKAQIYLSSGEATKKNPDEVNSEMWPHMLIVMPSLVYSITIPAGLLGVLSSVVLKRWLNFKL